jgi:hypothetical protein
MPLFLAGCVVLGLLSCCCFAGIFGFLYTRDRKRGQARMAELSPRPFEEREEEGYAPFDEGGEEADEGPRVGVPRRLTIEAVVETATFTREARVGPGQTCIFDVEHVPRPSGNGFWCHARVACGGAVLYGSERNGFFDCRFATSPPAVRGVDGLTSSEDTDPTFSIDTSERQLRIADDARGALGAFVVRATIRQVRPGG